MRSIIALSLLWISPLVFAKAKTWETPRLSSVAERIRGHLNSNLLDVEKLDHTIQQLWEIEELEVEREQRPLWNRSIGFCAAFLSEQRFTPGSGLSSDRFLALAPFYLIEHIDATFSMLRSFVNVQLKLDGWERKSSSLQQILVFLEALHNTVERYLPIRRNNLETNRFILKLRTTSLAVVTPMVDDLKKSQWLSRGDEILLAAIEYWMLDLEKRISSERTLMIFVEEPYVGAKHFVNSLETLLDFVKGI